MKKYTLKSPVPTSQVLIKDGYSEYAAGAKVEEVETVDMVEQAAINGYKKLGLKPGNAYHYTLGFKDAANWQVSQKSTLTERVKVLEGENEKYKSALYEIREWCGDVEYVETEIKEIATNALLNNK